jgi:peptide/nickel transport system permease protein
MTNASTSIRGVGTRSSVTGVQLMQGVGVQEARGFWADAWSQVVRRPGAIFGLTWIAIVAFFAVMAPIIASGHPIIMRPILEDGSLGAASYPLFRNLSAVDVLLLIGGVAGLIWMVAPTGLARSERLLHLLMAAFQVGFIVIVSAAVNAYVMGRHVPDWVRALEQQPWFPLATAGTVAFVFTIPFVLMPYARLGARGTQALLVGLACGLVIFGTWGSRLETFNYVDREARGEIQATYTLIPWSPNQRRTDMNMKKPGAELQVAVIGATTSEAPRHRFHLGTDSMGQDVLSQLLHACRLSVSIGLVSTGIAVIIGVTIGALMGYFGGWVDMFLYRIVEIFMAVPVLFLLIVAAAVLPRNTYVMMAIIGVFTWTTAARFTRAEFLKLRGQDFVQSAKAVGLPLPSVLFKHMLPNGVTPVLVDSSFLIAAAIGLEATLSYLGLGPVEQASWGRLLSDATGQAGNFIWWLAAFPGLAIFLTVLSYNLVGEAMRDAIDPKLKKARV